MSSQSSLQVVRVQPVNGAQATWRADQACRRALVTVAGNTPEDEQNTDMPERDDGPLYLSEVM